VARKGVGMSNLGWTPPQFPESFMWGTAASSTQCEGAAPASNWATWEKLGKAPPSRDGSGFWTRYSEDFALLKQLGLDHHRMSLEWARIEPRPNERDPEAIKHYSQVLQAARREGIHVWICLHHFTLPQWFENLGGFRNPTARAEHWVRHVAFVAEQFGDAAFGWMPINEPMAYTTAAFLFGFFPPGKQGFDSFAEATVAIFEAWAEASNLLSGTGPVATIHNLSPVIPLGDDSSATDTARLIDSVSWGVPIAAFRDGIVALPGRKPVEINGVQGSADYFGFSYYNAIGVSAKENGIGLLGYVTTYPPGSPPGPLGYHPWADGIAMVFDRLRQELPGTPLLVAENGIGTTDDGVRAQFLMRSLEIVGRKIDEGTPVAGYFHWTSVDNYEWLHGFEVPFGIISRDRRVKPSAHILRAAAIGH